MTVLRWAVPVALAAAFALGGCSGGSPGGGQPSPTAVNAAEESAKTLAQYRVWAQCMRDQGVAISDDPDQAQADVGASADQLKVAAAACAKVAPAQALNPGQAAADLERRRKNAQCMRDNGFPGWPDPDPNDPFVEPPAGVDMAKANETMSMCARKP